jgi:copper chaperone
MQFDVEQMHCQHCVRTVTAAIRGKDPQASVEVNLPDRKLTVQASLSPEQIVALLQDEGFPARPAAV